MASISAPTTNMNKRRTYLGFALVCATFVAVVHFSLFYRRDTSSSRLLSPPSLSSTGGGDNVVVPLTIQRKLPTPKTDPNPKAPYPRIAWLMSFPNSGTTYTALLIRTITNSSTASNNAVECKASEPSGMVLPVHDFSPNGPFLHDPELGPPSTYILTKTHCGGRCLYCPPGTYIETPRSFLWQCRTGKPLIGKKKDHKQARDFVQYDHAIVSRAVHLVRDPFDNIVARLHYARKNRGDEFADQYPDTMVGLHKMCTDLDDKYAKDHKDSRFFDPELIRLGKLVPCAADFYRYVQWHNLAFRVTHQMRVPTYVLKYERYSTHFDQTKDDLLKFLRLKHVKGMEIPEFITGKHYADYFTKKEHESIMKYVKTLASRETWEAIGDYFDGVDLEKTSI